MLSKTDEESLLVNICLRSIKIFCTVTIVRGNETDNVEQKIKRLNETSCVHILTKKHFKFEVLLFLPAFASEMESFEP